MKFSFLQSKNVYPFFVVFCLFNALEIKSMQQEEQQVCFEEHRQGGKKRKQRIPIWLNQDKESYLTGAELYQAARNFYKNDFFFKLFFAGKLILDNPSFSIMKINEIPRHEKFDIVFTQSCDLQTFSLVS